MQDVTLTPAQCRAARALVELHQAELAKRVPCSRKTVADFEGGKTTPHPRTLAAIRNVLEAAGVVIVPEGEMSDAGGAGVRLATEAANG